MPVLLTVDKWPARFASLFASDSGHLPFLGRALLVVECALALYCIPSVIYCPALFAAAARASRFLKRSSASRTPKTRFCIVIPAHNEQAVIADTLLSLCKL